MSKLNTHWSVIILFTLMTCLFNFRPLVGGRMEMVGSILIPLCLFLLGVKNVCQRSSRYNISIFVLLFIILFLVSPFVGVISRQQNPNPLSSARFLAISIFYVLLSYRFDVNNIVKAVKWMVIIYAIILVQAYFFAPNNIFGYREITAQDMGNMIEDRGVMRFAVPGADFVIMALFMVLTQKKGGKYYYLLLGLLFVLCFLRGTRVVFFSVTILSSICIACRFKNKISIAVAAIVIGLSLLFTFNALKGSQSKDPLTRLIQSTTRQLETRYDGTEDVRIMMATYFLTQFNQNSFQVVFGNGIRSSKSTYDRKLSYYNKNWGFWLEDSGLVMIYIYFGLVGIALYVLLLVYIIRLRLPREYLWAKYFILNQYLILIANTSLLMFTGSLLFGMALYVVYKGQRESLSPYYRYKKLVRF